MEMEDQLTPTQIKIIAGWSHNDLLDEYKLYARFVMKYNDLLLKLLKNI